MPIKQMAKISNIVTLNNLRMYTLMSNRLFDGIQLMSGFLDKCRQFFPAAVLLVHYLQDFAADDYPVSQPRYFLRLLGCGDAEAHA